MEISEIKSRITITETAERLGIQINKYGKALCPFHDDKDPGLQFSKEKNIATCFSARCNAGTMDQIKLTEKMLGLSTHEAILKLQEWVGVNNHTNGVESLSKTAVLTKTFRYFENSLKTTAKAKEYLASRGLKQQTPTEQGTEVGFNSGNFHQRENKHLTDSLTRYGLLKKTNSGHAVFGKNCLTFPLKDKQNKITGLYFRETDDSKENRHYYLKGQEGLYPKYPDPETKTIVLTESIIDAASLLQLPDIANQYAVLACYGTNGLTEEIKLAIKDLKELKETIIFFDGDEAGKKGTERNAKILKELIPNLKITTVETPENEDINSLAVAHPGKEAELFNHLLDQRKPFSFSIEKKNGVQPPCLAAHGKLNTAAPHKIGYATQTALYWINGGLKKELDSMRVSLTIENIQTKKKYRTKPDLYEHKQIEKAAREASELLNLRTDLLEIDLCQLTDLLEEYRDSQLQETELEEKPAVIMTTETITRCREFLSKPNLVNRINELIGRAGVIGEENNRVFLFGIAASHKMPDTLHALIQGSSGSGKTHLLSKISAFIPQEDRKHFTRVTEGSFYNYSTYDLKNKLICLEDLDGMKEEAYLAFRELQSRGMISSSTSIKDDNGNIRAFEKTVCGPIASMSCTTKGEIYEDNMSRCFLIAVDESKEQTQRIIEYQNRKVSGKIDGEEEKKLTNFLQNCVRILKPYQVVNPYADWVNLPEEAHKLRRLNDLYQSYVKQITLMNQYRRKTDGKGRLVSEKEDLQTAAAIMFDSIFLKIDELDGSLRMFYEKLKDYVKSRGGGHCETYSFDQREIRHALHVSKSQLQRYVQSLLELEYLQVTGGHANRGFKYKVTWWDNVEALKSKVKRHLQGQLDQLELIPA
jgi:DNA primase